MKKPSRLVLTTIIAILTLAGCSPEAKAPLIPDGPVTGASIADENNTYNESTEPAATPGAAAEARQENPPLTIRLGSLKGATSMGMVKLLEDAEEGRTFSKYEFSLAGSADELTPKLISGALDIAAIPANLASVLYNNTGGKIKVIAINALGLLYIVENGDTVKSLADLKGRTIYATGRGSVPEYTLEHLLKKNGLEQGKDVTIEWKSEPTEVVALMAQGKGSVAMLPQPYVAAAQGQIKDLRIAVDLTKEWRASDGGGMLVTGVLVMRRDFADEHPEQFEMFLRAYSASTKYVNSNAAEAAALIEKFGIIKASIAEKALPYCNIVFIDSDDMKLAMEGYLKALYEQAPKAVGGKLPDENFYYNAK